MGELGRMDSQTGDADVSTACRLPGGKSERHESPTETAQRLLESTLSPLMGCVSLQECSLEIQWQESSKYHVPTKYVKTVVKAELTSTFSTAVCRLDDEWLDGGALPRPLPQGIVRRDVLAMTGLSGVSLYAWLTDDEFKFLRHPDNELNLRSWLHALKLPGETQEIALPSAPWKDALTVQSAILSLPSELPPAGFSGTDKSESSYAESAISLD